MDCYQTISIREIHDTHCFDIHSFLNDEPAPQDLIESIRVCGILHPPIVLPIQGGIFDVICGRQRLNCSIDILQKTECLCHVLSPKIKPEDILSIILEDQFSHSKLTTLEQATFIDLCKKVLPEKKALNSFLNSIPQGRIRYGINFLGPLTKLDISLQKKIHFSIISEKILGELQKLSQQDQILLTDLIENLSLGVNNQKKLLRLITELHFRNNLTLSSLLADKKIQDILNNSAMNSPQKATQIFTLLYKMCNPLLSAAEEIFQKEVAGLKLPEQCQLKASKSFENDELTLEVNFESLNSFKQIWTRLKDKLT